MNEQPGTERFDLERWLRLLRERGWVIAVCLLLVMGSAAAFSLSRQKQYTAQASLLFRDSQLGPGILGLLGSSGTTDPARESETNVKLVQSPAVAARVAHDLGGISPGAIAAKIAVAAEGQSSVVSVRAADPDPVFAARLATTYARDFIRVRRHVNRVQVLELKRSLDNQLSALSPAERGSPAGLSLQARVDQLDALASLQTGAAELLQAADAPTSPSSPKTKRNVLTGAFLGLLLGFGVALLLERLNSRVREPDELSEMYGLPLLAEVPESPALNGGLEPLTPAEDEAFHLLRARLRYFNADHDIASVLITSGSNGEGKSTVAWHLARAIAASTEMRVLLLEADLRRPTIASVRELRPRPGLADVILGHAKVADAVQHVNVSEATNGSKAAYGFDVLVAGDVVASPGQLMETARTATLLQRLSDIYDFMIVDSAPLLLVADSLPLITQVGGVIVVSQVGSTTRETAATMRDQLRALRAPVLGVVANRVKGSLEHEGYAYTSSGGARAT
jgi:capsular exopolysaccharide synthesis family protein